LGEINLTKKGESVPFLHSFDSGAMQETSFVRQRHATWFMKSREMACAGEEGSGRRPGDVTIPLWEKG